ncbi:hypothetical protein [Mycobacterium sp. HUMS_1102779]|uniref:hypothetical protein n=1 Tax=Mycobacterium sp. HUMS_1102779 TaxID=3383487 RepID=UPI00389A0C3D
MAAKQRFCCTKHRVYASRSRGAPTAPDDAGAMPTAPDASVTTVEFEQRVKAEVKKRVDQYRAECDANVAAHKAKLDADFAAHRAKLTAAKGLITPDEYNVIRSCLHPDSRASASDRKLARAFRVFNAPLIKALLVK